MGGGRGIERIDVSVNGGNTWQEAKRLPQTDVPGEGNEASGRTGSYVSDKDEDEGRDKWSWVLWTAQVHVSPPCQLVVKAVSQAISLLCAESR